jgi:hypothetical protein
MHPATKIIRRRNEGTRTWKIGDVFQCLRCDSWSTGCTVLSPFLSVLIFALLCSALLNLHYLDSLYRAMTCYVMRYHVQAQPCTSTTCYIMTCVDLPCVALPCHVMSCHVMSCHVLSSLLLSHLILSCTAPHCPALLHSDYPPPIFFSLYQSSIESKSITYALVLAEHFFTAS